MGLNHETAPVQVREHFAVSVEAQGEKARDVVALSTIGESVVISTCNRTEVYAVAEHADVGFGYLREYLAEGHDPEEMHHLYEKSGEDVVRHLFRVVSGLDSMVLGETEIFGQVKQAYKLALESGATKGVLNKLFQKSFSVGKRVRTHTRIQMGQTSVGNVAVDLAEKIFGKLKGSEVMVIGAGETSRLVAKSMMSRGAGNVTVTNRTLARAEELAAELDGEAVSFDAWEEALSRVDVIVSSTGASEPVLRAGQIEAVRRKRKYRPLFLVDIAVPRDIEPEAGEIDEVYLYDIDKLQYIADGARESREQQVRLCEQMIEEEL